MLKSTHEETWACNGVDHFGYDFSGVNASWGNETMRYVLLSDGFGIYDVCDFHVYCETRVIRA
jgi:hypothetical protein